MFLLDRIDFIALMGLLVQAFVAWAFVGILGSLRRREKSSAAFDCWFFAFVALALALTLVSVRFFAAYEITTSDPFWQEGLWPALAVYSGYQGLKATFGILLVKGAYALVDRPIPRPFRLAFPIVLVLMLSSPMLIRDITPLLIVQAPVMVFSALVALRVLPSGKGRSTGTLLVRGSMYGLAGVWVHHAICAALAPYFPWMRNIISLNSIFDLLVQIVLGAGLIISLLQDTSRRLREAEAEGSALRQTLERDEKLRALGTLVSGVAHELNNPLTVILGYAEELADAPGSAEAAKIVGEQAERCRGIVRSLSALAGQAVHPWEELEAADLAARVVRGLAMRTREFGVVVRVGDLRGIRFRADRIGMEQVLTNLLANAAQASPPRGLVRLDGRAEADGVVFVVSDEGPGVPFELRGRLFEPFFTTKGPGQGTGLGLSVAHAIVRAHGGSVTIEDGPGGRGASFRVRIPLRESPPVARESLPVTIAGPRTLLVVDDDAAVRRVLRSQAERRGWIVSEAESAEDALAVDRKLESFDAILCDVRMPGMGGVGFHEALERSRSPMLDRVVFVTGDLASPEAVGFSARCRRPLVPKPFDFAALFAVVADAAAAAGVSGAPSAPGVSGVAAPIQRAALGR